MNGKEIVRTAIIYLLMIGAACMFVAGANYVYDQTEQAQTEDY